MDLFWIPPKWVVDSYGSVLASDLSLRRGPEVVLGFHHPPGGLTGAEQVGWLLGFQGANIP